MRHRRLYVLLIIFLLIPGCAFPESAKRVNTHALQASENLVRRFPDDPDANRAYKATRAMEGFLGVPEKTVHESQLDEDIEDLKADSNWFVRFFKNAPEWIGKIVSVGGSLATVVGCFATGNFVGGIRAAGPLIKMMVEGGAKHGNKELRRYYQGKMMGTRLGLKVDKEIVSYRNGNGHGTGDGTAGQPPPNPPPDDPPSA